MRKYPGPPELLRSEISFSRTCNIAKQWKSTQTRSFLNEMVFCSFAKNVVCKIILEGTLIVRNLKMINKMPTFPPTPTPEKALQTPMIDRAFLLSFFRYFRVFTHYKLFVFFRSCYYFIKIACNNKRYIQITTGVDYSKRQLKTVRFPI